MEAPRRDLGALTCLAVGLTTIVGSGIFALPSMLAAGLGPLAFLAFVGAAIVVSLIGLMTAEAAGTTSRHGGTYAYVSDAFGKPPAFVIGWLSWVNNILSWATVSFALVRLMEVVSPGLGSGHTAQIIATIEITAFGVLNAMGAKPGAAVSNLLTVAKLVPLVLFVVIGLIAFQPSSFEGSTDAFAITAVWTLDWLTLLDASVLFSLVQHSATTLAAWKLRRTVPAAGRFVAPGGPVIPVLALSSIVALVVFAYAFADKGDAIDVDHFVALALVSIAGLMVWGATWLGSKRT